MDLKKGLTYIAIGFLFTLVNFNLTLNGATINIMPDFVGWILLFLSYDLLGHYTDGKQYLKWISMALIILYGVIWVTDILKPELDTGILVTIGGVVSTVFLFIYFGILERIAEEYDSPRASTIGLLKYFYVALYVAFVVTALLSVDPVRMSLVYLATILGFSALVVSIMTAFVLFKLRNDIRE